MPVPLLLDASALIKRYVAEPAGCATMQAIVGPAEFLDALFVSEHIEGEIIATLNRKLRRGELLRTTFRKAYREFYTHYPSIFGVVPCDSRRYQESVAILAKHSAYNIGASDALHLAAAQHLRREVPLPDLTIVVVDGPMGFVARRLGFPVFNPETDPLSDLRSS